MWKYHVIITSTITETGNRIFIWGSKQVKTSWKVTLWFGMPRVIETEISNTTEPGKLKIKQLTMHINIPRKPFFMSYTRVIRMKQPLWAVSLSLWISNLGRPARSHSRYWMSYPKSFAAAELKQNFVLRAFMYKKRCRGSMQLQIALWCERKERYRQCQQLDM